MGKIWTFVWCLFWVVDSICVFHVVNLLQAELARCLERDGFKSILEAVGADCR